MSGNCPATTVANAKATSQQAVCKTCKPKKAIPLIFVPGIMGSVLTHGGKMAWNPSSTWFMLWNYGRANGKEKRAKLIGPGYFNPEYLQVNGGNDPNDPERGWTGLYSGYDEIRAYLEEMVLPPKLAEKFVVPAHAFGYNWSNDNYVSGKKLSDYIQKVIQKYNAAPTTCDKVILITHSMGGLVARSACKLHGAAGKVLGVVHGVQPVTGAPVAYWRMKAGFERSGFASWASAQVLGANSEEVVALLGNMPGALELLPTQHYQPGWLILHDGRKLPGGNPYSEIYGEKGNYWNPINPNYLNPGSNKKTKEKDWAQYKQLLKMAESFHQKLGLYQHGTTWVFYGTGMNSCATVSYRVLKWHNDFFTSKSDEGEFITTLKDKGKEIRVKLNDPSGDGDGTVPVPSGKILAGSKLLSLPLEHEPAYRDGKAQKFTYDAIVDFAQKG